MRWLILLLLLLGGALFGGYVFVKGYPYRLYSKWINGEEWNKFYFIEGYSKKLLSPIEVEVIPAYKEDYAQLWYEFPLRNTRVPLPVRHPLFKTVPLVEYFGDNNPPNIGMVILNPGDREISRLYTLPGAFSYDHSQGQDLFKLPFVRNRILKFPLDKLWKDLFTYEITVSSKPLEEMIYDLYILHIRSKLLPKKTTKYGLIKDDKAIIEVESPDKDYLQEIVLTNSGGNIYSYLLRTEKNSEASLKLRAKLLDAITFISIDPAFGKILYTEFKALNFARQVDQEGMLYLFSAWTQEMDNQELLKEMIFYLERGRENTRQLKPLYAYALKKFGKTFTTRENFSDSDDQNVALQRRIELENQKKLKDAEEEKGKPPVEAELTPEEKMNLYLKKAKETGPSENKDMTIH